ARQRALFWHLRRSTHGKILPRGAGCRKLALKLQPPALLRSFARGRPHPALWEPIMRLRSNGIEITALHSHMLGEQPRLFFMHFWANDDAMKLARGLRAALDKTARS